jgi:hypothetical protein
VNAAGWENGGYAATVRKAGVEDWLRLGYVIAQSAGNVLHCDRERFRSEPHLRNRQKVSGLFDENMVGSIDHDFADVGVEDEMLDWSEERQDELEPIHQRRPSASCWK